MIESNTLIDFPDAEGIALEAAGIDEFDFDAYTTHGGDLFCDIGYTIYYKVYFRAEEDGTEYACVVRAKDGEVMSLNRRMRQVRIWFGTATIWGHLAQSKEQRQQSRNF